MSIMNRFDELRTARFNVHIHERLHARYHWRDTWSAIAMAVLSAGAFVSILAELGKPAPMSATAICAILAAIRPIVRWGDRATAHLNARAAWLRVQNVAELMSDQPTKEEINAFITLRDQADASEPPPIEKDYEALRAWAYALTNQELPAHA